MALLVPRLERGLFLVGAVVRLCARRGHVTPPAAPLFTRNRPWSRADTGLLPLSCCSDPTVAWLIEHQLLPQAQQVQCSWSGRCCCAKARMVQELSTPLISNADRPKGICVGDCAQLGQRFADLALLLRCCTAWQTVKCGSSYGVLSCSLHS